jgi:hypothetical protein
MRTPSTTTTSTAALRSELEWLRARYDGGTISPAIFSILKAIEHEIAWREYTQVDPTRVQT